MMDRVSRWFTFVVGAVIGFVACRQPRAPANGDELEQLRQGLEVWRAAEPAARLGCTLLPLDPDGQDTRRRYCHGALDNGAEAAMLAEQLLAQVDDCKAGADAFCLETSLRTAAELLRRLQGRPTPAASSSPAPAGSAP